MKKRIAVPTMLPGGLETRVSSSFQQCECFTLVDVDRYGSRHVRVIPNILFGEGKDLALVSVLNEHDVDVVIVEEIGRLNLAGLQFTNIEVFRSLAGNVSTALKDYRNGILDQVYYGSPSFRHHLPVA